MNEDRLVRGVLDDAREFGDLGVRRRADGDGNIDMAEARGLGRLSFGLDSFARAAKIDDGPETQRFQLPDRALGETSAGGDSGTHAHVVRHRRTDLVGEGDLVCALSVNGRAGSFRREGDERRERHGDEKSSCPPCSHNDRLPAPRRRKLTEINFQ